MSLKEKGLEVRMINRLNPSEKSGENVPLNKEMQFNLNFAKDTYKQTGKFMPMVVGISGNHRYVVPCHWANDTEKYKLVNAIKGKFRGLGVTAIVVMTEAWSLMLKHPALYNDSMRPSEHPDRVEVFILNYTDKNGTKCMVMPIIREEGEVTLGVSRISEKEGLTVVDNLFGNYFNKEEKCL